LKQKLYRNAFGLSASTDPLAASGGTGRKGGRANEKGWGGKEEEGRGKYGEN